VWRGASLDGTFTVDVEDYFHVSAFSSRIKPQDWPSFECRVEQNTRTVLDIAAENGTRGTFFVLGWVAKRYPGLVREIYDAGHEIGCHSQWHQLVYDLGPDRFRADLVESRETLQNITGDAVTLYRSPSFSITKTSLWALEILIQEGFDTDSSIYPIRHDRYGIPTAPPAPHLIHTPSGPIREFPGMVYQLGPLKIPVGGGGYLRLFPWQLTKHMLHSVRKQNRPLNVYVHPWEFDPTQPRIQASLKSRFRHYQNLKTTASKIRNILSEFRLGTMSQVLDGMKLPETGRKHSGVLPAAPLPAAPLKVS